MRRSERSRRSELPTYVKSSEAGTVVKWSNADFIVTCYSIDHSNVNERTNERTNYRRRRMDLSPAAGASPPRPPVAFARPFARQRSTHGSTPPSTVHEWCIASWRCLFSTHQLSPLFVLISSRPTDRRAGPPQPRRRLLFLWPADAMFHRLGSVKLPLRPVSAVLFAINDEMSQQWNQGFLRLAVASAAVLLQMSTRTNYLSWLQDALKQTTIKTNESQRYR